MKLLINYLIRYRKVLPIISVIAFSVISFSLCYAQNVNEQTIKDTIENKKLTNYIYKHATSVIELRNGDKMIGKITGEMPNAVFIKRVDGDIDEKIDRNMVKTIRKPTAEELQDLRIILRDFEIKDEAIPEKKAVEQKERNRILEKKYQEEVRSAQKTRRKIDSKKSNEDRIKEAKDEGYICNGMGQSDVVEVLGWPNRKEIKGRREIWHYDKGDVNFYDGKVRQ